MRRKAERRSYFDSGRSNTVHARENAERDLVSCSDFGGITLEEPIVSSLTRDLVVVARVISVQAGRDPCLCGTLGPSHSARLVCGLAGCDRSLDEGYEC